MDLVCYTDIVDALHGRYLRLPNKGLGKNQDTEQATITHNPIVVSLSLSFFYFYHLLTLFSVVGRQDIIKYEFNYLA